MASCTTRQFSAISEHSLVTGTPSAIEAWLTSLPPASPVSLSALPENAPERMTRATCGPQPSSASAWYDRGSHSWRTFQVSFLAATLEPFSETWPKAGMMHAGAFYPQPSWEHRISAIDYGLLLPTPLANEITESEETTTARRERGTKTSKNLTQAAPGMWPTPKAQNATGAAIHGDGGLDLQTAVMLATPQARDFRTGSTARWEEARKGLKSCNLNDQIGGQLNPTWVEWLMGWPLGWTDLKPLATDKFRQWFEQHGCYLEVNDE